MSLAQWESKQLAQVFKLTSGKTKPSSWQPEKSDTAQIPVYGGNGINGWCSEVFVNEPKLIIGRVGEYCGSVHLSNGPCWITDNALYTKDFDFEANDLTYFSYLLAFLKLDRLRSTGGQPLVSQGPIHEYEMNVPPLQEQKKIAEILLTWDRAIEASQEQERLAIKQLEAIRSRIFQQTEGTKKLRLGDLIIFNYGKSPKDIISESGEYPIIGTGGVTGRTNEYLCADGGIVVGRKGTIDKPQLISSSFWPIDTTYYITKSEKYDLAWVYHQLFALKLKQYNEASGVPSLNRETIGDLDVHLPPLARQKIVGETLNEVQRVAEAQNLLTASLIKQKQGLMQKLLTGKVRVKV